MSAPKVSIIIPIYKAENYLENCLCSIKGQTMQEWEAILVDDGSPDSSGEICDRFSAEDSRFITIHKKNAGVGAARQTGLDNATGEYVTHADPDDWVEPDLFEETYSYAIEHHADIVLFDYYLEANGAQQICKQMPSDFDSVSVMRDLFKGKVFGSCWSKLVRRSAFVDNNIRFREDLPLGEDTYITACLFLHGLKIVHKEKAYYHYIRDINPQALTKVAGQSYEYDVKLRDLFNNLLQNHPCQEEVYKFFCGKIVSRAYSRHVFSNFEFIKYCFPYLTDLGGFPMRERLFYTLSCMGFYNICYSTEMVLKKLIKK